MNSDESDGKTSPGEGDLKSIEEERQELLKMSEEMEQTFGVVAAQRRNKQQQQRKQLASGGGDHQNSQRGQNNAPPTKKHVNVTKSSPSFNTTTTVKNLYSATKKVLETFFFKLYN